MEARDGQSLEKLERLEISSKHGVPDGSVNQISFAGRRQDLDKQSLDYLWRSGLAGGLAGCAVLFAVSLHGEDLILKHK